MITSFHGDNSFLSNFYPSPILFEGHIYRTIEHAFQAAKTDNQDHKQTIREKSTPGKAKHAGGRRGKLITLRDGWDSARISVMTELCRLKFQDPQLRQQLLDTAAQELQEGNRWNDTFWGVSLKTGKGQNHLGKILMQVRAEIEEQIRV